MVGRVHGRVCRVAVPEFPYSRSILGDHVSPARVVLVGGYAQRQILASVFGQAAHEVLHAQYARADVAAKLDFGLVDDVVEDAALVSFGHKSQTQREKVARHRIVAVAGRLTIEELLVVGLLYALGQLQISLHVLLLAADAGEAGHALQYVVEDGGAEDRAGGLACGILRVYERLRLGRHAPVAVGVVNDDAVLHRMLACVLHPLLHGVVVAPYGAVVAVVPVEHVGAVEEGR